MLTRLRKAQDARVPVTNYGVAISFLQGVISRSLRALPFRTLTFENEIKRQESYLMRLPRTSQ